MMTINYNTLNYDNKLLYIKSVFEESQDAHPVYKKLLQLLSWSRKIEEKHLDMLYDQIHNVLNSLHTDEIVERMGALAAQLENIQRMEAIDREHEHQQLIEMERLILAIDDDKPVQLRIDS